MAIPLERARAAWALFMAMLSGVFVTIAVALNLMLWWLVIRPVTRLSHIADRVSLGDLGAPQFRILHGRDEIGRLALSFGRMRKSLVQAMKMLEGAPT